MKRQHQHADHIFPEEGAGEQVAAKDFALPDRPSHHDRVKSQRLDHHRRCRKPQPFARGQIPKHQKQAGEEDDELDGSENALDQRPG
jgi:hypothetical protein